MNTPDFTPAPKAAIKSTGIWGNVLALAAIVITLATTYNNTGAIPETALAGAFTTAAPILLALYGRVTATRPIGGIFTSGNS